jgi:threonine/homoserine/homoserine lactone efflux protein
VKTAIFFLALLPQFVDATQPVLAQLVSLGLVCVTLNTAADVAVVYAASRVRSMGGWERALAAGAGCTLVGLGAYVALTRTNR